MNTINDDDLLNGEEFDYEGYSLDGDQEEELLQDDFEEETEVTKDKITSGYGQEEDEEEDVLTLDVDDEERLDKTFSDESAKGNLTRTIENKPKPIPTTTNNVNNKKISPGKPRDRPPPTTKTLTTHEKNSCGRKNQKKIDHSRRGGKGGRGAFNSRLKNDFQKRRGGTVLINPRYKGTVPVNDNARLAWDVNSQPPANYIQPWAAGVLPTSSNNSNIQDTLLNLVSHLRHSADVPPNTFNSNMPMQQNDYFQAPPPLQRNINVFEHPPVFQQAAAPPAIHMQLAASTYGQTQHASQWENYYNFNHNQLPNNSYGGGDLQNQFNRQISNDRLYNSNDHYTNSYQGRNENFQPDYSQQSQNNYYSNSRNEDGDEAANFRNTTSLNKLCFNRNSNNNYNRNNSQEFVQRTNINNNNTNRKNTEANLTSTSTAANNLKVNTVKQPRLQVISADRLMHRRVENNDQVSCKRIMFEDNKSTNENEATLQSVEDEEMRLYNLQIEAQKRLREQVLRRKEENRKKLMEERLQEEQRKQQEEKERLRNQEEQQQQQQRRKQQQEQQQMSVNLPFMQQVPVEPPHFQQQQQRVFSAPKVPPVTICKPKIATAMPPKASRFERFRENLTIIPTDDFANTTFTIKNDLPQHAPPPTINEGQPSNTFRTNRVITVKNLTQKHVISPWAKTISSSGIDSSNVPLSQTISTDPAKASGSGIVDEPPFSSFLNRRKIVKHDKNITNTRLVTISNLSANTDQRTLESLTQGAGEVQKLRLDAAERKATVLFKSVASAQNFYKKYQRHMLDLSMIEVKLEPML